MIKTPALQGFFIFHLWLDAVWLIDQCCFIVISSYSGGHQKVFDYFSHLRATEGTKPIFAFLKRVNGAVQIPGSLRLPRSIFSQENIITCFLREWTGLLFEECSGSLETNY